MSPSRREATVIRTSRCSPLISDIEPISAEPSRATSRSKRSRPYARVCTWFHSVYGYGMRTSVENPLSWRTPHSDRSARLNARSPMRASRSSTRVRPDARSSASRCLQSALLVVKNSVLDEGSKASDVTDSPDAPGMSRIRVNRPVAISIDAMCASWPG